MKVVGKVDGKGVNVKVRRRGEVNIRVRRRKRMSVRTIK